MYVFRIFTKKYNNNILVRIYIDILNVSLHSQSEYIDKHKLPIITLAENNINKQLSVGIRFLSFLLLNLIMFLRSTIEK